jgi:hypothetical protein
MIIAVWIFLSTKTKITGNSPVKILFKLVHVSDKIIGWKEYQFLIIGSFMFQEFLYKFMA